MTAEILVIALTILGDARGEGFEGMAGVASVIQTRAIERKQTASQVCLSPKQFSFWNGGVSEAKKKKLHYYKCNKCKGATFNANTVGKSRNVGLNDRFSELLLKYNLREDLVEPFKLQLHKFFQFIP